MKHAVLLGLLVALGATGAVSAGCGGSAHAQDVLATPIFNLIIDGNSVGDLRAVRGGDTNAEVLTQDPVPPSPYGKKQLAAPSFVPITFEVGMDSTASLYAWMQSSFQGEITPKNGSFLRTEFDYTSPVQVDFDNALLSRVTVPALDGKNKDPAYMTIVLAPEVVRMLPAPMAPAVLPPPTKSWLTSNFRVEIGDLPCDRVSKVDSFSWTRRADDVLPTALEVSNLKLRFPVDDMDAWRAWADSFILQGQSADEDELSGSITFLAPDLMTELGRIDLLNVGISGIGLAPHDVTQEGAGEFTVELYIERIQFAHPSLPK